MSLSAYSVTPRRATCLVLAGITMLATVHGASADEGIGGFLQSIFGGGTAPSQTAAPTSTPSYPQSSSDQRPYLRLTHSLHQRPLIVRLHKGAPKLAIAQAPTKPGKVSIYEDRTLRRGDAVMTAEGVRIFAGSISWPYTAGDFVALATAKDLNRDTVKVLAEVDRLPRN
ncbi:MAG: hypothetical protein ACRYGP_12225 [Janthinobacterium lividum]